MAGKRNPTHIRFLEKFHQGAPDACWEWRAGQNGAGYGMIWSPEHGRKVLAHRYSYAHFTGRPLPDGTVIMHSCDNPACVNPAHLSVGTMRENAIDCSQKRRRPQQKYAADQIEGALRDYVAGVLSHGQIAAKHGVSRAALTDFISGRAASWMHGQRGCPTTEEIRAARRRTPNAKMDVAVARKIKGLLRDGVSGREIARQCGVHFATISDIKTGKSWKDAV